MMFPIGVEFKPTGEQLIVGYLWPWVTGQKLEWNGIVDKQMYGENSQCEPWKVFSDIESSYHSKIEEKGAIKYTIYAFTTLLRASNSKRVSRRAGKGTWGGQTGPKKIEDSDNGFIIGHSKMLAYEHSEEAGVGHWTMHEYCLSDELVKMSGRSNAADLAVCKITKTVKKKSSDGRMAEENKLLSPGNEYPCAQTGVDPIAQVYKGDCEASVAQLGAVSIEQLFGGGYRLPFEQPEMSYPRIIDGSLASIVLSCSGGYEAPVPVPASSTVSMKRAAVVDLRNEGDDLKRQKCDGKEYSDRSHALMETGFCEGYFPATQPQPQPNPEGSGDGWVRHPMIIHEANALDVTVPTDEQSFIDETEELVRRYGDSFFLGDSGGATRFINHGEPAPSSSDVFDFDYDLHPGPAI